MNAAPRGFTAQRSRGLCKSSSPTHRGSRYDEVPRIAGYSRDSPTTSVVYPPEPTRSHYAAGEISRRAASRRNAHFFEDATRGRARLRAVHFEGLLQGIAKILQ